MPLTVTILTYLLFSLIWADYGVLGYDHLDVYRARLESNIERLEDRRGELWLIAPDLDLMIHGGAPLPPDLKAQALRVKEVILDIMHRSAAGRF